jgi:VIT1/CCC1 family predicted Fe2+/Mn2+ transporter
MRSVDEGRRPHPDPSTEERRRLEAYHEPDHIRERLGETPGDILGDAVLGAVDGAITTFAVVAGSLGGGFSSTVVIVLGFANLLADGLSMAVSNYLATRSERERVEEARRRERRHIDVVPEGQRDEVRQIFAAKGFAGDTLESIVDTITRDRRLWVDTVVREVFGLTLAGAHPLRAGLVTLVAFIAVGSVPLLPFLIPRLTPSLAFATSAMATAVAFVAVGVAKGRIVGGGAWRSGLQTLATGGAAAVVAFAVGQALRRLVAAG